MTLDEVFEQANFEFLKSENKKKHNLDSLTLQKWAKEQLKSLEKYNIKFSLADLVDWVLTSQDEKMRNLLNDFTKSNYHIDLCPSIEVRDLNLKDLTIQDLGLTTSKEKKDRINSWIAENRTTESFDFEKKSVIQLDPVTGSELKKFPNISEAKKYLGIKGHNTQISECCKGEKELAHGFKWKFLEVEKKEFLF